MTLKNWNKYLGTTVCGFKVVGVGCSVKNKIIVFILLGKCGHELIRNKRDFSIIRHKIICLPCAEEKTQKKTKYLTPLRFDKRVGRHKHWLYKCICGKEKSISAHSVVRGHIKSCGCMGQKTRRKNSKKYIGRTINNFKVIGKKRTDKGSSLFHCKCNCGKSFIASNRQLCMNIKSCGCLLEARKKITPNDKKEIKHLVKMGYTIREISNIYSICWKTAREIIQKLTAEKATLKPQNHSQSSEE